MWSQNPSFRFEINNFSTKKDFVASNTFVSNGCEWYVGVYPKGDSRSDGHLSVYLCVGNCKLLPAGWKRSNRYYFVVLNQSGKELYKSPIGARLFCAEYPCWGFRTTLPVTKLHEEGVLEKDILVVEIYIESLAGFISETKESVDINGFQVLASKVTLAEKLFAKHPDIAEDFKPKDQEVKNAYMKVLLKLIKKLKKYPRRSLSETDLSKACSKLSELTEVGFKVEWLKSKLDEISLEKKKTEADASRVLLLEERLKKLEMNSMTTKLLDEVFLEKKISRLEEELERRVKSLELMELGSKFNSLEEKLDDVNLVREMSDSVCEARDEQVEKRIKKLELMEIGVRMESLETKLDEVSLERKKSDHANESRAQQLEEHVKESLEMKLDEVSLERKKSDDANESRVQKLEEHVKELEVMGLGVKLETLNRKLDETKLEIKLHRLLDTELLESRAQQLEERVKGLELMELGVKLETLNRELEETKLVMETHCLNSELVESRDQEVEELRFELRNLKKWLEGTLERKKSDESRIEESVKDLVMMLSELKAELDKKKDKSSADGFFLVD